MGNNYVVKFKNVSKVYKMQNQDNDTNEKSEKYFYALKNINIEVEKGESVGILGTNGSGKSTISKILAGLVSQDEGTVDIKGAQALIAINSGLNNKLTGLENIELKGVLLGFSKEKIKEITESVIEFSELGDFIHQPVKKYSSGMKSRLGFSISINLNPDIIIVDEALSVGDKTFNEKCLKKINEMKERGKTIFFVSHSIAELKNFCNKGMWIEGGILKEYNDIDIVAKNYEEFIKDYKSKSEEEKQKYREAIFKQRIVNKKDSKNNKTSIKKMVIAKSIKSYGSGARIVKT